jgi:oligoribonuclease NrnB/cAMP/cGMP phosphodiesterase (DHH superfamily)
MKNLCIYHKSCADGFGAALAVKVYFDQYDKECDFLSAHYGDEAPDVTGLNVVIVDFSYPRETLIKMNEQAESIVVLDHHKTAQANLEGLDFCIFDMGRSGAMMAWEHFHKLGETPELIRYIQDRDLWQWQLESSKELSSGLQLLPFDFDLWQHYLDNDNLYELKLKGKTVLEYQEQQVKRALAPEKIRMVTLLGHSVPIVNSTTLISEICGALAEDHPFAISYFDTPKERVYSLRSRGDGEDVSAIAKTFGGGGHAAAAGFSIPHNCNQL